jgi:isopentenyl diphosphate isomerase/L-lactate dehydrogenase-like FMN-dependent dehydrogenase
LDVDQFSYIYDGAGNEDTVIENRESFQRWRIVPRVLRAVAERKLSVNLLGKELAAPFILAPVRGQAYLFREGELATARAASSGKIPFILSNYASATIEKVAEVMGNSERWFQLYPCADYELMVSFLRRAEHSGYGAIVVTVDKMADYSQYHRPKKSTLYKYGYDVFFSDPIFRSKLRRAPEVDQEAAIKLWHDLRDNSKFSWETIRSLRGETKLPILLKGILHPDDAQLALDYGVGAIIVSNHGGRSMDGEIATLDALPKIGQAVGDRIPLLIDGGIRSGTDVIKALALGAKAVVIGKAYLYALAVAGEEGVRRVINQLTREIDEALAICGCSSVREVNASIVVNKTNDGKENTVRVPTRIGQP